MPKCINTHLYIISKFCMLTGPKNNKALVAMNIVNI